MHFKLKKSKLAVTLTILIQQIRTKSPIHENTNAKITCDFGDERCCIAAARLEKDIREDSFANVSYSSKDAVFFAFDQSDIACYGPAIVEDVMCV